MPSFWSWMSSSSFFISEAHPRPSTRGAVSWGEPSTDLLLCSSPDWRSLKGPDSMLSSNDGATSLEEELKQLTEVCLWGCWWRVHRNMSLHQEMICFLILVKLTQNMLSYQWQQGRWTVIPALHYVSRVDSIFSGVPVYVKLWELPVIHILQTSQLLLWTGSTKTSETNFNTLCMVMVNEPRFCTDQGAGLYQTF